MNKLLLSLPIERPERYRKALDHLRDRKIIDPITIMGFDGNVSGLVTTHPYEVDDPGSGFNMGPKPTGILLAHYMAWQVAKYLPDDISMIMEDDVNFHPDWYERVTQALKDIPEDWDALFVGSCDTKGHETKHMAGQVYEVCWPQCLHCYLIRRKAIGYMMATQRQIYGPIDCTLIFHTWPHLNVYTLLPRAADQFNTEISE